MLVFKAFGIPFRMTEGRQQQQQRQTLFKNVQEEITVIHPHKTQTDSSLHGFRNMEIHILIDADPFAV